MLNLQLTTNIAAAQSRRLANNVGMGCVAARG